MTGEKTQIETELVEFVLRLKQFQQKKEGEAASGWKVLDRQDLNVVASSEKKHEKGLDKRELDRQLGVSAFGERKLGE